MSPQARPAKRTRQGETNMKRMRLPSVPTLALRTHSRVPETDILLTRRYNPQLIMSIL